MGIAHDVCGKVIVAAHADELPRLEDSASAEKPMASPACDSLALRSCATSSHTPWLASPGGAVDRNHGLCEGVREICGVDFARSGTVITSAVATGIRRQPNEIVVETSRGAFSATALINCAGPLQRPHQPHGRRRTGCHNHPVPWASTMT